MAFGSTEFGGAPFGGRNAATTGTQTLSGVGIASGAAAGVASLREKVGPVGRASTAANGVGTLSLGAPTQTLNAVGRAGSAASGVGALKTRIGAVGRASTTTTGTAQVGDIVYTPSAQDLDIWIGEAGDTVAIIEEVTI